MPLIKIGDLTNAEKQEKTRDLLVRSMQSLFSNMRAVYVNNYRMVWQNPDGLTPQEVFDGFGEAAVEFFSTSLSLYRYLNMVVSDSLDLPAPYELTANADGTITVGEEIETTSSSSSASSKSSDSSESSEDSVSSEESF